MKRYILMVVVLALLLTGCKSNDYEKAVALHEEGKYEEAIVLFLELEDYKDSADRLQDCYNAVNYENATTAFIGGDYQKAIALYRKLGDYKDSTEKLKECYITVHGEDMYNLVSSLKVGNTLEFGTFEQDNNSETTDEKILWHVVDKQGESALLLSDKILIYKRYVDGYSVGKNFKWEQSAIFEWLNIRFYDSAFTKEEQNVILLNNPSCTANVFLLSDEEAANVSYSIREAQSTKYASATNSNSSMALKGLQGYWALRTVVDIESPTIGGKHYLTINKYGDPPIGFRVREEENEYDIADDGLNCDNPCVTGIRPAIWISLDA